MRYALVASVLCAGLVVAAAARAGDFVVGLSGATDRYLDNVSAPDGEAVTIHVCAFGGEDGETLEQSLTVIRWVVLQACCGASLELLDVTFNPEFQHAGNPLAGVVSTLNGCRTDDAIWLATLRVRLRAPRPGSYLWLAGAFGPSEDCEGVEIRPNDLPLQMLVPGDESWGALHAEFYDGPRRY